METITMTMSEQRRAGARDLGFDQAHGPNPCQIPAGRSLGSVMTASGTAACIVMHRTWIIQLDRLA